MIAILLLGTRQFEQETERQALFILRIEFIDESRSPTSLTTRKTTQQLCLLRPATILNAQDNEPLRDSTVLWVETSRRREAMDKKILDMMIALQPKFREVMGEWKPFDIGYDPNYGIGVVIESDDNWVMFTFPDYKGNDDTIYLSDNADRFVTRLPLTIDDSSKEARQRSLWGMLSETGMPNETLYIGTEVFGNGFECGYTTKDGFYEKAVGGTPTEAILRALCAQEGLEVKE
jgi:hypothetical protein